MTIRNATLTGVQKSFRPVLRHWALLLLLDLDGHRFLVDQHGITDAFTLGMLGMSDLLELGEASQKECLDRLWRQRETMKVIAPRIPRTSTLGKNIAWLARTLDLNEVEWDIVAFLAMAQQNIGLERLLEKFGAVRTSEIQVLLGTVLGHPTEEIARALHYAAPLLRSNLVWLQATEKWSWTAKIGLLPGIGDLLALSHGDPFDLFASNLRRCPPGHLTTGHYPHLEQNLQVLLPYLREALRRGERGVNVLFHGPPGTGKTELAKALAQALGAPLFEVAWEDRNGNVIKGEARFGAFQLAQGVLGGDPSPLLVFDEVEDVFQVEDVGLFPSHGHRSGRKAWMNRQLTDNRVPTFWITNSAAAMDPAYLRRFAYILEVGVPPNGIREGLLEQYTQDLQLPQGWTSRAADHGRLTPAAIQQAALVTRVALGAEPMLEADRVMALVLNNTLGAMGLPRITPGDLSPEAPYRPDLINADRDLDAIARGLKVTGEGRLCLYGAPGTGKTAWGRHLAKVLDRPLHVHRASDLLGAYVGETEGRMAKMFQRAQDEGALLLLDEADSFFRNRNHHDVRGWEVSLVNEMLVQTEAFKGVFVASTNGLDRFDLATLRRFDLKIRFEYLNPAQAEAMLKHCLNALGIPPKPQAVRRVRGLSNLTPGDFAVVMRQGRLEAIQSAQDFVERLRGESVLKGEPLKPPIGFGGVHGAR